MLSAIIVAGGSSQRMGFDKLLAEIAGRPVITHSLNAFGRTESVAQIVLVARAERLSDYEKISEEADLQKIVAVVPGGNRRQDSVQLGLAQLSTEAEFVAVHDAARPLVTPELIERTFQLAQAHGSAACASPVIDTLKRANEKRMVTGSVERTNLFAVQTPQIFRRDLLDKAYAAVYAAGREITDEVSAVEFLGEPVALLPNEEPNFKITYPADLKLAECVLQQSSR